MHLDREHPVGVVVGLPLNEQGGEGPAAREARASGAFIAARSGLPVAYWDERMSTARVQASRREAGGTGGGSSGSDALAATVILQTFLDGRRS